MDAELIGEVFGGTLAPAMAGGVADRYGLAAPLWIAAAGAATVLCAGMFLPETAPRRLASTGSKYQTA